jgi:hypothetical protein
MKNQLILSLGFIMLLGGSLCAQTIKYVDTLRHISFEYPAEWKPEEVKELNVLLLMCPDVESDWKANASFEVRLDSIGRDFKTDQGFETALKEHALNLKNQKEGFQLVKTKVFKLSAGYLAGSIEYIRNEGKTKINEREILIPKEKGTVLFVLFSTVDTLKAKYIPTFDKILNSLILQKS